ncbi:MAG: hypothetical protein KDA27_05180 [Candidatus Eisenbacteria bacterium]|uniref:Uncharacterized protein n=1 Tax=Eiseniibacteriota bacterium TaxID=2212470 RepID=A0A956NDZ3_UNCEI|nr:hypothetical protein [Candidatus Eisenbacteria bacterium]
MSESKEVGPRMDDESGKCDPTRKVLEWELRRFRSKPRPYLRVIADAVDMSDATITIRSGPFCIEIDNPNGAVVAVAPMKRRRHKLWLLAGVWRMPPILRVCLDPKSRAVSSRGRKRLRISFSGSGKKFDLDINLVGAKLDSRNERHGIAQPLMIIKE